MRIPLDRTSAVPLYHQISEYISRQIQSGAYPPGSRLPSARELARENRVSRSTAEKVYEELESLSLVQIRPGSGVFTLSVVNPDRRGERGSEIYDSSGRFRPFDPVRKTGCTDFSFGGGDPGLFPLRDFKNCLQKSINRAGADFFSYGDIRGYAPLRHSVASILSTQGLMADGENIILTNGSQQALSLLCRRYLRPGSRIACESFCYGEALNLFRAEGYEILPVPMDKQGLRTDVLKDILEEKSIDMLYTIPNFQNPTGTTLSGERRRELIELMDRYGFPLIEDDYIGDLDYEGSCPPSLKAMAGNRPVFYIGTFSKMLIPGLRFGFMLANEDEYQSLVEYKRYSDLTSSLLTQHAMESFINLGRYQNHIDQSRRLYRKRRDRMVSSLRKYCPHAFQFSIPEGGIFLWLTFKKEVDEEQFYRNLQSSGVVLSPGWMFQALREERSGGVRLNFAYQGEDEIEEGIKKLASALPD